MFNYTHERVLSTSLVGIFTGFLGGSLGLTGPVILLPILIFFGIFNDYKQAIATVLFSFEPFGSLFALIEYAKEKKIDYVTGLIIVFSYMFGSYLGAKFNKRISEKNIKYISASFMMLLSLYLFYSASQTYIKEK
jgi:uncharacterized membrane protein YfcA